MSYNRLLYSIPLFVAFSLFAAKANAAAVPPNCSGGHVDARGHCINPDPGGPDNKCSRINPGACLPTLPPDPGPIGPPRTGGAKGVPEDYPFTLHIQKDKCYDMGKDHFLTGAEVLREIQRGNYFPMNIYGKKGVQVVDSVKCRKK